jgi:hypothetical protein
MLTFAPSNEMTRLPPLLRGDFVVELESHERLSFVTSNCSGARPLRAGT